MAHQLRRIYDRIRQAVAASACEQFTAHPTDARLTYRAIEKLVELAACLDQQTIDEMTAMRRLGDREGEAITSR